MSARRGEREQPKHATEPNERRPWWRRAGVWVGGIAAAAITAVATTTATQVADWVAVSVDTTGPPVEIRVEVEESLDDVVLPRSSTLSAEDLATLSSSTAFEQIAWLQQHEDGTVTGTRSVVLTLRGNRAETVRITDLQSIETCRPIERGTLVRMMHGRGAGVDSERVNIDVGQGSSGAYIMDESSDWEPRPYFPDRTITLVRDEEFVMIVDLHPGASGSSCEVELDLTVWDGDTKTSLSVPNGGDPFAIADIEPESAEAQYEAVHLGGGICRAYVPAPRSWPMDIEGACGPGNLAPWPL